MRALVRFFATFFMLLLLLVNVLAVVWLFLCYAASMVNPASVQNIAIFSLSSPFAIIANVFLVIVWLLSGKKWGALLSFIALAICYKIVFAIFAFNFMGGSVAKKAETVKVMSWNVHGMGIFDEPGNTNAKKIMALVKAENPDIFCTTEYFVMDKDSMKPYSHKIIADNKFKEYRIKVDNSLGTELLLGTAVFSKFPIVATKHYQISKYIYMLQCDMQLQRNNIVRMFFVHLCSFMLSEKDRAYLSSIKNKTKVDEKDKSYYRIFLRKFNADYAERATEANLASRIIESSPYPVLIAGDFNDLPASYTYTTMRAGLNDAFVDKGFGIGRTYNQLFPTLRIDHIFYDPKGLHIIGYKCPSTPHISDHNPVIANFEVPSK